MGELEIKKGHVLMQQGSDFNISAYLQEQMCFMGQQQVFDEAEKSFLRLLGICVSDKQIERVCHYYGEKLEEKQQMAIASGENSSTKNDRQSYYVMLDGGMVLTREEKWKEMKLARIFDVRDKLPISKDRNYIGESTYVAHLGGHKDFLQKTEYHLDTKGELIFIADGSKWIWKWVEAMYPESIQILDFYHATQHLFQWAEIAIKNPKKRERWVDSQIFLLLNDKIKEVIDKIKKMKTSSEIEKREKQSLVEYYTVNQNRMLYKTAKQKGLLIGSGPIEAAHRHVIQQRMKLSGQRWTIKGAQQIANLRVSFKSNTWKEVVELTKKAA
jgi:hypothetical protein